MISIDSNTAFSLPFPDVLTSFTNPSKETQSGPMRVDASHVWILGDEVD